MIPFPAIFAFASEVSYVTWVDAVILLFLEPLVVAPECHAPIAVLGDIQWFVQGAFLDADNIEEKVILRCLRMVTVQIS